MAGTVCDPGRPRLEGTEVDNGTGWLDGLSEQTGHSSWAQVLPRTLSVPSPEPRLPPGMPSQVGG